MSHRKYTLCIFYMEIIPLLQKKYILVTCISLAAFYLMKLVRHKSNSPSDHRFKSQRIVREGARLRCTHLRFHQLCSRIVDEPPLSQLNNIHPNAHLLVANFLVSTLIDLSTLLEIVSCKILMF